MTTLNKSLQCKTIEELSKTFCEEIKKLTNYHRVIIYKFNTLDYSGIVIGEAFDEDMTSYMGLRFPSTDIPAPVREMYVRLPMRYIPSVLENPVRIVSMGNQNKPQTTNLKNSNLRMVAPIHANYMKNMGICSSVSIALMRERKLWGLIACHHRNPKYLSQSHRQTLALFAKIFANQALVIESIQNFQDEQKIGTMHAELTRIFRNSPSLSDALAEYNRELMQLLMIAPRLTST